MRINTELIHKGSDTNRKKLFCCSIFRMKHKYRGFYVYVNTLLHLIEYAKIHFKDWTLRIYLDDSISQPYKEKFFSSNTEVVRYHSEDFWDPETKTHEGVFGTFIRYLPIFSSQIHEVIAITDIDIIPIFTHILQRLIQDTVEFGGIETTARSWASNKDGYKFLGQSFVSKVVFPRRILTNFLINVKNAKFDLNKIFNLETTETILPYGSDEYFLNTVLIPYIHKTHTQIKIIRINTIPTVISVLFEKKYIPTPIKPSIEKIYNLHNQLFYNPTKKLPDTVFVEPLKKILPYLEKRRNSSNEIYFKSIESYLKNPKIITEY